ncbi:MAG: hypothetical protein AB4038_13855 [Prochloraceae cyanobacterium]
MTQPFKFPHGELAYNAEDLVRLCQQSPTDGIYHLMREDLEKWLVYIGQPELAASAKQARLASLTNDEERLQQFLGSYNSPIAKPSRVKKSSTRPPTPEGRAKKRSGNPLANLFKAIGKLFTRA